MIDEPPDTEPEEFATVAEWRTPPKGKSALTIVMWLANTMPVEIFLATSAPA